MPRTASDTTKTFPNLTGVRKGPGLQGRKQSLRVVPRHDRQRFLLVHNTTAGVLGNGIVAKVITALAARGASVVHAPARSNCSGPLAVAGFDAVLAAGGDGTVRALAGAVEGLPVGIIPAGTGNVLATEIGLRRTADSIADVLVSGPEVEIETARANGAPFLLMAGAGFDGAVVGALDMALKRRVGKAAYTLPVLRTLISTPVPLEVTVDGRAYGAGWVVVTKATHYGGSFVISREAGLLKPGLKAVIFKSTSRIALLRQLLALATGGLERDKDVTVVPCRHVTVAASTEVPVQIDGDAFGATPLVIEAGGPRVRLIVPAEYAARQTGAAI